MRLVDSGLFVSATDLSNFLSCRHRTALELTEAHGARKRPRFDDPFLEILVQRLPVLDAAHIRPFGMDGPHDPRNGLLLRSDIHTVFDRGYVTVTPESRFLVSKRIREEFENGRDYYALSGRQVELPVKPELRPSFEYLDWHASQVFRG